MNIKIAIIGVPQVGKSAFRHKHLTGTFIEEYKKTEIPSSTSFYLKTTLGKINVQIYEHLENMEGIDAYILMYDVSDVNTLCFLFTNLEMATKKLRVLCGNKIDKLNNIHNNIIQYATEKFNCNNHSISVKNNTNIEKPIVDLLCQKFGYLSIISEENNDKKEFVYMKLPKELYLKIYDKLNDFKETQKEFEKSIY